MYIVEDSRQQAEKHRFKHEYFDHNAISLYRSKIVVGDYILPPAVSVDTKASLQEIAQNIGGSADQHKRFINELKLAQAMGTKLLILIENEEGVESIDDVSRWYNPRRDYSFAAISGERLAKAMRTIETRYGCTFLFCTPQEAGKRIVELLEKYMSKEAFIVHANAWNTVKKLSLEQRGSLLSALMCYQLGEPLPDLDFATEMAFSFMADQLDRDNAKYEEIVEKRKAAGRKGAGVRWDGIANANKCHQVMASHGHNVNVNDNDNVNDNINVVVNKGAEAPKSKRQVFKKPSLQEVQDYCRDRNNDVDAERFIDYYEANGWRVGKNPMKDWRAAVRTWERNAGGTRKREDRAVSAFEEWAKNEEDQV